MYAANIAPCTSRASFAGETKIVASVKAWNEPVVSQFRISGLPDRVFGPVI